MKEYKHGNITVTAHEKPNIEKLEEAVRKFAIAVEKEKEKGLN